MLVLIPTGGKGQRFKDAGYTAPKNLLPMGAEGLPMEDYTARQFFLRRFHPVIIPGEDSPSVVHTLMGYLSAYLAELELLSSFPVVVNNVDNYIDLNLWNFVNSFDDRGHGPEYGVAVFQPSDRGGSKRFSYVTPREHCFPAIESIDEKVDPSGHNIAVAGTYWFSSIKVLHDACERVLKESTVEHRGGREEIYLSDVLKTLHGEMFMIPEELFKEYGTPGSYESYNAKFKGE